MITKTFNPKTKVNNQLNGFDHHDIGDEHLYTGLETPMKPNAFKMSDE